MKFLLLGGYQDVGKSETIWRTGHTLQNAGFVIISGSIPPSPLPSPQPTPFPDFLVALQGKDKHNKTIVIVLNSATDYPQNINNLVDFLASLKIAVDIIISSIKDANHPARQYFFSVFRQTTPGNFLLEIPLARISKRRNDFGVALIWYQQSADKLIYHCLSESPYNIY